VSFYFSSILVLFLSECYAYYKRNRIAHPHHWGDCPVFWHRHGHASPFATSNGRVFQAFLAQINFGNPETEKTQEAEH